MVGSALALFGIAFVRDSRLLSSFLTLPIKWVVFDDRHTSVIQSSGECLFSFDRDTYVLILTAVLRLADSYLNAASTIRETLFQPFYY